MVSRTCAVLFERSELAKKIVLGCEQRAVLRHPNLEGIGPTAHVGSVGALVSGENFSSMDRQVNLTFSANSLLFENFINLHETGFPLLLNNRFFGPLVQQNAILNRQTSPHGHILRPCGLVFLSF